MEFVCPICETGGSISNEAIARPVTKTTCRQCGTILLVNAATGDVDAHKSPFKGSGESEISGTQMSDKDSSVLEMHPRDADSRDWTAIIVVAAVLIILIAAGIYFLGSPGIFEDASQSVSELIRELLPQGEPGK